MSEGGSGNRTLMSAYSQEWFPCLGLYIRRDAVHVEGDPGATGIPLHLSVGKGRQHSFT